MLAVTGDSESVRLWGDTGDSTRSHSNHRDPSLRCHHYGDLSLSPHNRDNITERGRDLPTQISTVKMWRKYKNTKFYSLKKTDSCNFQVFSLYICQANLLVHCEWRKCIENLKQNKNLTVKGCDVQPLVRCGVSWEKKLSWAFNCQEL